MIFEMARMQCVTVHWTCRAISLTRVEAGRGITSKGLKQCPCLIFISVICHDMHLCRYFQPSNDSNVWNVFKTSVISSFFGQLWSTIFGYQRVWFVVSNMYKLIMINVTSCDYGYSGVILYVQSVIFSWLDNRIAHAQ